MQVLVCINPLGFGARACWNRNFKERAKTPE